MSSNALMAILGFVFWVIVVRFYSEAELGYSAAIISALGLVSLVGYIGLDSFVLRLLSRSKAAPGLINTCLAYGSVATLGAALVFLAGIGLWSPRLEFVPSQPIFLTGFVCFAIPNTLFVLCGSAFVGGRKSQSPLVKNGTFGLIKLFLPLTFVRPVL